MEGNAQFKLQDITINKRFKVLGAVDCPNLEKKGEWYSAIPHCFEEYLKLNLKFLQFKINQYK